jgi:predicted ATP-grasp superfamily ATP-dependent carboligase
MRIFVYEHFTGGGLAGELLAPSLAHEGDLMARALVEDLADLPGITVVASRDQRLGPLAGAEQLVPLAGEDPRSLFRRGLAAADAAWPTAPETDGILELLARETLDQRKLLIGCHPEAVRLASSKRATAAALREAGIPVVPTFGADEPIPPLPGRWVVKPDDGAGCEDTVLVEDWEAARRMLGAAPGRIAQPWIDGEALSLSLVCTDGIGQLLSCNRQWIRLAGDRVSLEGISVNAIPDPHGEFARLAQLVAAAILGLQGYVGIDLIRTSQGLVLLEINPRLTTSYAGLRGALEVNPAAAVLAMLGFGPEPEPWPPDGSTAVDLDLEACHAP